jgi:phosphoribosylformylglycinamidine synthase
MSITPNFLILWGDGINCENETAKAVELAGGHASKVHINDLIESPKRLEQYQGLIVPGGFSFGDHLGSGQILSLKLERFVKQELEVFVKKFPVMGVCNGFQTLVRLGLLPDANFQRNCSLVKNESGHFQNAWVELEKNSASPCIWTKNLPETFFLPARHGEGRFFCESPAVLKALQDKNQIVLRYAVDFNGAVDRIAGVCDSSGLVFALMPHPEAAVYDWHLPFAGKAWGLDFFKNAVQFLK